VAANAVPVGKIVSEGRLQELDCLQRLVRASGQKGAERWGYSNCTGVFQETLSQVIGECLRTGRSPGDSQRKAAILHISTLTS